MYNPSSTIKFREAPECFGRGCSPMSPEQSIKDPVAKRISGGGEPDPERADQGSAAAFGRRKSNTGRVRKALADVAATAKPETILGWYRKLIANKFDGNTNVRCARSGPKERAWASNFRPKSALLDRMDRNSIP